MHDFEINADDSSDEEEVGKLIQEYDLYDQFVKSKKKNNNSPGHIRENDPNGLSLLAYTLGVNQLYSPEVNKKFYEKKAALGKTRANVSNEKLEAWFLKSLQRTILNVFALDAQKALTDRIAANFRDNFADVIKKEIKSWIEKHLRSFFKQTQCDQVLSDTTTCLSPIEREINQFINCLKLEEGSFAPSPFFIFDDFDFPIQNYMGNFFREKGFIRENGSFETQRNWPKTKSDDPIEKIMISEAGKYNGCQNISHVGTSSKNTVLEALLEKELNRGKKSIIEKVEGKYRLKQHISKELIEESKIGFLFGSEKSKKYLPYNLEKLQKKLSQKVKKYFKPVFIKELKQKQKKLKIKLERGLPLQQHTYVSKDAFDFHANLRLSMRIQRRHLRQARDDEGLQEIHGECFQAAWQFGGQKYAALETQEITVKGGRTDQIVNLETYSRINTELTQLKERINKKLNPKINDSLIASWIREIITVGYPVSIGRKW